MKSHMMIAAYVVRLVVVGLVWSWLHKMRSAPCECSGTWKRDFLYWSLVSDLVLRLLAYSVYDKVSDWMKIAIAVFDLYQMGLLWSYARDMQKASCECSEDWKRELAQSWPVFRLGVLLGVLQMAFLVAFLVVSVSKKKKKSARL